MRTKRFIFKLLIVATVLLPLVLVTIAAAEGGCHDKCGGTNVASHR